MTTTQHATTSLHSHFTDNLALQSSQNQLLLCFGEREHDRFQLDNSSSPKTLPRLIHEQLDATATYVYDPDISEITLEILSTEKTIKGELPTRIGEHRNMNLINLLQTIENTHIHTTDNHNTKTIHLIINGSYLFETPNNPIGEDFRKMSALESFARRNINHVKIFIRCSSSSCIPSKLSSLPYVGELYFSATSIDERCAYMQKMPQTAQLAKICDKNTEEMAKIIAKQTDGLTLSQLTKLLISCIKQNISNQHTLEETIMSIRNGIAENPWASDAMREQIRTLPSYLRTQVIGQDEMIKMVTQPLRDAVVGMTDAHKPNSQAPRAKLLLAGSTGTGKTETCKAMARHLFGDETILRFDCGEFSQEHSSARLVGSPPGYIGHESGGELIEGIKQNPASLILFDEIEKAHPKIWNIFLGILDDGCVTSGQGEKVYLNNCILVFTTNLGSTHITTDSMGNNIRKRSFDTNISYQDIRKISLDAISDYFTSELGKPELEGRFGGKENFIVFDMLRQWDGILDKYISNCIDRAKRLYNHQVSVSDEVKQKVLSELQADNNALMLGGRGLAKYYKDNIESVLTNHIFDYPQHGQRLQVTLGYNEQGKQVCQVTAF